MKRIYLTIKHLEELLMHSREDLPNEACGMLVGRDERVERVYRMSNREKSPIRFSFNPKEQFEIERKLRDLKLEAVAIYHSHPETEAYPTEYDIKYARYLDVPYLIISLKDRKNPILRLFQLKDGKIKEGKIVKNKNGEKNL